MNPSKRRAHAAHFPVSNTSYNWRKESNPGYLNLLSYSTKALPNCRTAALRISRFILEQQKAIEASIPTILEGSTPMEHQIYRSHPFDLNDMSLVVPREAACSIGSPSHPQTQAQEGRMTSTFGQLSHFAARSDDGFGIAESSPSTWGLSTVGVDEYTSDPRFLECQRELRHLLLTTAQSLAPTRATSPVLENNIPTEVLETTQNASAITTIVSTGERVLWLRNYLEEVAPWVYRDPSIHMHN
jgi:hypothetical protein